MNEARRKLILAVVQRISEIKGEIEEITSEEQDYFDNMPEAFQSGDKGQAAENAISLLEDAANNLDDAITAAENAVEG